MIEPLEFFRWWCTVVWLVGAARMYEKSWTEVPELPWYLTVPISLAWPIVFILVFIHKAVKGK